MIIAIVASGPSVEGVDLRPLHSAHVIAVNFAVTWAPVVHSFFSLDPSPSILMLLQQRHRREGVKYHLAVPHDWRGTHRDGIQYLRRISGDGVRGASRGLSEDVSSIHTGNSAFGALGLAYHMRPRKILLLGVDATDNGYAYNKGSPNWSLGHLPDLFATACDQLRERNISIVNGSPRSLVTCFTRMDPQSGITWLLQE